MEFREAAPEDAEALREVALASLRASYGDVLGEETIERAVEGWYDPDGLSADVEDDRLAFLVAAEEGEVAGFVQVHVRTGGREAGIQWLHVDPDRRGEGIGGRLLEYARDVLDARGVERLTGAVLADNEAGNEFYREHGFGLREQRTVEVGGDFYAENVYQDVEAAADPEPVETPEGVLFVDRTDEHRGRNAPFLPVYRDGDGTRRYGWLCGRCGSVDTAMDTMDRIECNECGNVRKPDRWDAAYL